MMSFLHDDEGDAGFVVCLQLDASLADGRQLKLSNYENYGRLFIWSRAISGRLILGAKWEYLG